MDWFKLNRLLINYKKSQCFFFGPHYPIQYEPEFLLQDLYEVCPHYLLLSEKYTDLEEQLADDSLQRVYVKREPLLKDLYAVAPYYTTREHIVTNQGILIEQDEVKYLGIILNNTLKFTTHINAGAHISLITMLYPIINMHDTLHAQLKILRLILHLILYFIISLIYKKLFNLSNSQLHLCGINCR